jgi:hypothetical protein
MTLHMLEEFDLAWMARVSNAFLIREPRAVLASYVSKRADVTLADIGFVQQQVLFDRVSDMTGCAAPVVDASDILADPGRTLDRLCGALGVPYTAAMLRWPPGRRPTDGVWAPAWYQAVERSTGFGAAAAEGPGPLSAELEEIAARAEPYYAALWRHRLW